MSDDTKELNALGLKATNQRIRILELFRNCDRCHLTADDVHRLLAKEIVQNYTRRLARYRCDNCGFKARQFYWRCPACGGWETYSPKRSEEFELTP